MFSSPKRIHSCLKYLFWISFMNFSFEYLFQHSINSETLYFIFEFISKFLICVSLVIPIINMHMSSSKISLSYASANNVFIAFNTLAKECLFGLKVPVFELFLKSVEKCLLSFLMLDLFITSLLDDKFNRLGYFVVCWFLQCLAATVVGRFWIPKTFLTSDLFFLQFRISKLLVPDPPEVLWFDNTLRVSGMQLFFDWVASSLSPIVVAVLMNDFDKIPIPLSTLLSITSGIGLLLNNSVLGYEFQAVHKQFVRLILLLIASRYCG